MKVPLLRVKLQSIENFEDSIKSKILAFDLRIISEKWQHAHLTISLPSDISRYFLYIPCNLMLSLEEKETICDIFPWRLQNTLKL